jgi:hypothetical protein
LKISSRKPKITIIIDAATMDITRLSLGIHKRTGRMLPSAIATPPIFGTGV